MEDKMKKLIDDHGPVAMSDMVAVVNAHGIDAMMDFVMTMLELAKEAKHE